MFEEFNVIPIDNTTISAVSITLSDIVVKLRELIPSEQTYFAHQGNYKYQQIMEIITRLNSISASVDSKETYRYYIQRKERFERAIYSDDTDYGIVINEEASTHFNEAELPRVMYLEGAQNHLKQSPTHFLRIFTIPCNKKLFVYTNKELTLPTLYKLWLLDNATNPRNNKIGLEFIKCCANEDAEGARKVLEDFLNSDYIQEMEFKKFQTCLKINTDSKIRHLKNQIESHRREIADYENTIAQLAVHIRDMNEQVEFMKYRAEENDQDKILFKHLSKHPYIKRFEGDRDGYINLYFEAPMIYFNEEPLDKLIEQTYRHEEEINILKIFRGNKYELITRCEIRFNTQNFGVNVRELTRGNVINHPHIDRYQCFGNHRTAIEKSAEAGDYLGAIEQISQAVLNLNFYDGTVVNSMLHTLIAHYSSLKTWRCKETGVMLTTEEVIEGGNYEEA